MTDIFPMYTWGPLNSEYITKHLTIYVKQFIATGDELTINRTHQTLDDLHEGQYQINSWIIWMSKNK
jgi:hypothetical protein